jgi:hypothetical protein
MTLALPVTIAAYGERPAVQDLLSKVLPWALRVTVIGFFLQAAVPFGNEAHLHALGKGVVSIMNCFHGAAA